MHKKIIILLLILLSFTISGCNKKKTIILFNNYPITKENLLNNSTQFIAGKRIYYVFITEKKLDTNLIRVRVLKRDKKANYDINKVVYSNDFRMNKDQVNYYNDYIVMQEDGYYCMVIYARDEMDKPLAVADFQVK